MKLDSRTRCAHYHGPTDIIAIKMRCCGLYFACKKCHDELADHPVIVWPEHEWDQEAVLCGGCRAPLTILEYLRCDFRCAHCGARFNPRCRSHHHLYFQSQPAAGL